MPVGGVKDYDYGGDSSGQASYVKVDESNQGGGIKLKNTVGGDGAPDTGPPDAPPIEKTKGAESDLGKDSGDKRAEVDGGGGGGGGGGPAVVEKKDKGAPVPQPKASSRGAWGRVFVGALLGAAAYVGGKLVFGRK